MAKLCAQTSCSRWTATSIRILQYYWTPIVPLYCLFFPSCSISSTRMLSRPLRRRHSSRQTTPLFCPLKTTAGMSTQSCGCTGIFANVTALNNPTNYNFVSNSSKPQQYKMAKYCDEIFGELLLKQPLENTPVNYLFSSGWLCYLHWLRSHAVCYRSSLGALYPLQTN